MMRKKYLHKIIDMIEYCGKGLVKVTKFMIIEGG